MYHVIHNINQKHLNIVTVTNLINNKDYMLTM